MSISLRLRITTAVLPLVLLLGGSPETMSPGLQDVVLDVNFPDPCVIKANGKYFAFATNGTIDGKAFRIPFATSTDLKVWKVQGDALPAAAEWASHDFWAPHVIYDVDIKKYVMYYSAESKELSSGKCIGVAYSETPEGPFIDKGTPLICGESFVNIDPMAFIDPVSGRKFLYWGSGHKPIKVQEMTKDWSAFKAESSPRDVIYPNQEKKYDQLVEGAWVSYKNGKYYLYYSGDNCCGPSASYAVMVARSDSPLGPFLRYGQKNRTGSSAILEEDADWKAPGHNSIFNDGYGNDYIAYHALVKNRANANRIDGKRVMLIKRIKYKNGWPVAVR